MKRGKSKRIRLPNVDVQEVRIGTGLSVEEFAHRFGLTPASVRSWEQGRTEPYSLARILLAIIAAHPEVVDEVLRPPEVLRPRIRLACPDRNSYLTT